MNQHSLAFERFYLCTHVHVLSHLTYALTNCKRYVSLVGIQAFTREQKPSFKQNITYQIVDIHIASIVFTSERQADYNLLNLKDFSSFLKGFSKISFLFEEKNVIA